MATGFSVMDALNKNSKAGVDESPRARFRTKDISIFKMYRNKLNFYDLADIEELAGDILMYGLKQNLEVVFEPNEQGEYRIVAGERRWLALKHLVEQGYKDFEIATCKLTTPQDEDEEQVEIIIANAYRTKSLKDVIEEEQRLKACLERMKTDGKKIKGYDLQSGRLRDVIASMLKMSKTKIAQIESVNNNLIPEFREELNNERLTFSAAYELSGMSPEMQQEALAKYKENGELSFYVDTELFVIKQYEEEINYKMLTDEEQDDGFYYKYNEKVLFRTDSKTQMEYLKNGVSGSIMKPNEARRKLDLPDGEGGDTLLANGSIVPLTMAGAAYQKGQIEQDETEKPEQPEEETEPDTEQPDTTGQPDETDEAEDEEE